MLCWTLCSEHVLVHYLIWFSLQTLMGGSMPTFQIRYYYSWASVGEGAGTLTLSEASSPHFLLFQCITEHSGKCRDICRCGGAVRWPLGLIRTSLRAVMLTDVCTEHLQKSAFRKNILLLRI